MKIKNNDNIDLQSFADYFSGKLSDRQAEEIELWRAESEENAILMDKISDALMLQRGIITMLDTDTEKSYSVFKEKLSSARRAKRSLLRRNILKHISVAAVFLGAVILSGFISVWIAGRTLHPMVVRTNIGERTQIDLPDGSQVWLNACSEMRYEFSLFSRERKVFLAGEGYFEVNGNAGKPFIVNCDGMDVKVLGTKFNVMANHDDDIISTTLLEGSVEIFSPFVNNNKRGIIISPNDCITINKRTGTAGISHRTGESSVEWINGRLQFEGNTFEQIARTLERNYNIEIVFRDEQISQRKFTCSFSTYDNIYRIMSILRLTEKFDYAVHGRIIEIESR